MLTAKGQEERASMLGRLIAVVSVFLAIYIIYNPERHAKNYEFISEEQLRSELLINTERSSKTNLQECPYWRLITNNVVVDSSDVYDTYNNLPLKPGGEYIPQECSYSYRSAIIVPYRDRPDQLKIFLRYMHHFLQTQFINYQIFVVDQNNTLPFNRAKLLNYGAAVAMKHKFDCLILHDVDLMPLSSGNIYACSKQPRHMSSSLDMFRFNLPYLGLFGGVISISSEQFRQVNGMSNLYDGWGGEDDDFYARLQVYDIKPYRFAPQVSRYTMLKHKKETPSADRFSKLKGAVGRQKTDGLNTLKDNYVIKLERLYTLVITP